MAGSGPARHNGGMMKTMLATRRNVLAAFAVMAATPAARAQSVLDATTLGLVEGSDADQSDILQHALGRAADSGQVLRLPRGTIHAQGLDLPGNLIV